MTISRTTLFGTVIDASGAPVSGAQITARLTDPETEDGAPVKRLTRAVTGEQGGFNLSLWPNTLGVMASCYTFRVGDVLLDGYVPSPDVGPVELSLIAVPRDSCAVCGKNCPIGVPSPQLVGDGWYADVDTSGLYADIDTTGLYAQVETAVLTSKPYPVEAVEEFTLSATLVAGNLAFKLVNPVDSLDVGAAAVSGELRVLLKATTPEIDSLDVGVALTAGELRVLLKSVTPEVESIDVGAVLIGGVLIGVGVSLTPPAEEMTVSATLTAGALL